MTYPSPEQVSLAQRLIDAGASVVCGHHPHVVQGVERYRGGIIAYSLGNFVMDMWQQRLRESMVLKLTVTPGGEITHEIIPVAINASWQPIVLSGVQGEKLLAEYNRRSKLITDDQSISPRYHQELDAETRRFRREICRHYLTHLHRYNPRRLAENLIGATRKRL